MKQENEECHLLALVRTDDLKHLEDGILHSHSCENLKSYKMNNVEEF
jgi:hypothetical protein